MIRQKLKFYYWSLKTYRSRRHFRCNIQSIDETIDEIVSQQKGISRFGDGEIRLMIDKGEIVFQAQNKELSARLREVAQSNLPNLIIGLPQPLHSLKNIRLKSKYFWTGFLNLYANQVAQLFDPNRVYGNSFVSRFYMIFENKAIASKTVAKLKKIWDGKEILIVEGTLSRLGVGNDLFENAATIKRLICPHENAFSKYDEILNAAMQFGKDKLILIALGPTATVLSHDLAKEGFWALDVGHIDVEYVWMLMNAQTKVPIKGKYVSEARDVKDFEIPDQYRDAYQNSIIHTIAAS